MSTTKKILPKEKSNISTSRRFPNEPHGDKATTKKKKFHNSTNLEITGNRLDKSLNLVCSRLKLWRCDSRCSLVSIAMLIWSFIILCELCACELSFRYMSRRLRTEFEGCRDELIPEPRNNSSRSILVV